MRSRKKPVLNSNTRKQHEHSQPNKAANYKHTPANAANRARLVTELHRWQRAHAHPLQAQVADATAVETATDNEIAKKVC